MVPICVDYYLMEAANLSRAAIDFIGLMLNLESTMYISIVEIARDFKLLPANATFMHIDGGNDRLIDALEQACYDVPHKRCSIYLKYSVTQVIYNTDTSKGWRSLTSALKVV